MTAKEYLGQYLRLKHSIHDLMEERQRWQNLALRITPSYSADPKASGTGAGRIQTSIEQIEEWELQLSAKIEEQLKIRKEIERTISLVGNQDYQTLLRMRYIMGYIWERIAEEMHYGSKWIFKMHRKALDAFEKAVERDLNSVI